MSLASHAGNVDGTAALTDLMRDLVLGGWLDDVEEETMSVCARCEERGKTWSGGDPVCGFPEGVFDASNWMCATLNALRELAETIGTRQRHDDRSAALIPCDPADGRWPYVVLEWYKNRGRTEAAWELNGTDTPSPLTLETAARILTLAPGEFSQTWFAAHD